MTEKARANILMLIALILLSLALACGAYYFYTEFQKAQSRATSLQETLDSLAAKQQASEKKIAEDQARIAKFDSQLKEAQGQIDSLNNQLQQERAAKAEAQTQLENLRTDLDQQKKLRSDLEEKFVRTQDEVKRVQVQMKELADRKNMLEQKIKQLEEKSEGGVELGKIVVSPEAAVQEEPAPQPAPAQTPPKKQKKSSKAAQEEQAANPQGLTGKVLVVNKDYNFAVINLGSKDGVRIGSIFGVYRDTQYLGDVKVEKVHDSMAAAGFVSQDIKNKVNEGDKVVQKKK